VRERRPNPVIVHHCSLLFSPPQYTHIDFSFTQTSGAAGY
jgi:hypothetical protein